MVRCILPLSPDLFRDPAPPSDRAFPAAGNRPGLRLVFNPDIGPFSNFFTQNTPLVAFPSMNGPEEQPSPPEMNHGVYNEPWRTCYRQLAPKLLLYARQWVASTADAEDIVQTTFIKFWKRQPDARPEHYPLLYAALRTTAMDYRRGQERRDRRESDAGFDLPNEASPFFDTAIQQREDAELVEAALKKLPAEQREVLVLRIWGELTFAQIAESLGLSINTITARHRYALDALRKLLKPCVP